MLPIDDDITIENISCSGEFSFSVYGDDVQILQQACW
jgi:hypothetical protein